MRNLAASKRNTTRTGKRSRAVAREGDKSGSTKGVRRGKGARKLRIERIREEIKNGTYETEGKLRIAISRLIDDVLAKSRKGRG